MILGEASICMTSGEMATERRHKELAEWLAETKASGPDVLHSQVDVAQKDGEHKIHKALHTILQVAKLGRSGACGGQAAPLQVTPHVC